MLVAAAVAAACATGCSAAATALPPGPDGDAGETARFDATAPDGAGPSPAHGGSDAAATQHDSGWQVEDSGTGAEVGQPFDAARVPVCAIRPTLGPPAVAALPPPAISGGTLLVTRDGKLAVAADPDRDAVYVVDVASARLLSTIVLAAGDEPGRLVEDGVGRIHVALRGGASLATLDPVAGAVLWRRSACPSPRGVGWDGSTDLVWVACATGEIVALPAAGGPATRSLAVERDLRDVIVVGAGALAVSELRSAQVLRLAADGAITRRDQLPSPVSGLLPHVAWRAVPGPAGTIYAVHQAEATRSITVASAAGVPIVGAYGGGGGCTSGGGCGGGGSAGVDAGVPGSCLAPDPRKSSACNQDAVVSALTAMTADGTVFVNTTFAGAVPVDVAVSADGSRVAAVAAGNAFAPGSLATVFLFSECGDAAGHRSLLDNGQFSLQPTAVAFDERNRVLVQAREPASLWMFPKGGGAPLVVPLSPTSRDDTGHDIFHTQAGVMIACASCHPEGGDDGHVWTLDGEKRRTPSLRGTIAGTAPYHWPGSEPDMPTLVNDVYTGRMAGPALAPEQMGALGGWVQGLPPPPSPAWVDPAAAARGKVIYERSSVGCTTCHAGPKLTNNLTVDVGTGGAFQVPPLVGVGWRTPLLHDGCAATMADRFGRCATSGHGNTSHLSAAALADLVAYLETL